MLKVCVGSRNPSKLLGVEKFFRNISSDVIVKGYYIEDTISQPIGLDTIITSARYRAKKVMGFDNECDFYIGIEAGLIEVENIGYFDIHVTCIMDKNGTEFYGFSPAFMIPKKMIEKIISGEFKELEEVVDAYFGTENIGEKGGFISLLTKGIIRREDLVYYSVAMALVPIINSKLYLEDTSN